MTAVSSLMIIFLFLLVVCLAVLLFIEIVIQLRRVISKNAAPRAGDGALPDVPVRPKWLQILKLIFLLGVFGALVIPIILSIRVPPTTIKRARIISVISNFKNLETGIVCYLVHPSSNGRLPVTESPDAIVPIWNGREMTAAGDSARYTVEQILVAYDIIERRPQWRIGVDGTQSVNLDREPVFSKEHQAYYAGGLILNGAVTPDGSDWSSYNRAEVSYVDTAAGPGLPGHLPVVFRNEKIDRINFYLDGVTPLQGKCCAYVILKNVELDYARKLSFELNGNLDDTASQDFQYRGRLIFDAPRRATNKTDIYYYLSVAD
jgi:hypothetical protein